MTNFVFPQVEFIGFTDGELYAINQYMETDLDSSIAEDLMEFAGRSCYQSFGKPNPATKANKDYLQNIIAQGHESVLEHATVTYYITGVSRALTHEFVRHRHFNYSQQSQRFVNEEDMNLVLPPAIDLDSDAAKALQENARLALKTYSTVVDSLLDDGLTRKQAREAARAVLPNMAETRIVVTGNHRAWREFLRRRLAPGADAEIQRLSRLLLDNLYHNYPALYEDIAQEF